MKITIKTILEEINNKNLNLYRGKDYARRARIQINRRAEIRR